MRRQCTKFTSHSLGITKRSFNVQWRRPTDAMLAVAFTSRSLDGAGDGADLPGRGGSVRGASPLLAARWRRARPAATEHHTHIIGMRLNPEDII